LVSAELTGLLQGGEFQGARQQRSNGRHRDVLHLRQIDIKPGTLLAPMLPHDDFSPALSQFLDVSEILRRQLARSHVASLQRDPSISPDEILP